MTVKQTLDLFPGEECETIRDASRFLFQSRHQQTAKNYQRRRQRRLHFMEWEQSSDKTSEIRGVH